MDNKSLKNIIELYCGRKVKTLNVVRDPENSTYFALRVKFDDENIVDFEYFLIQSDNGKYDKDSLEEVEFTEWPPTNNKKNMYKLENMNVQLL